MFGNMDPGGGNFRSATTIEAMTPPVGVVLALSSARRFTASSCLCRNSCPIGRGFPLNRPDAYTKNCHLACVCLYRKRYIADSSSQHSFLVPFFSLELVYIPQICADWHSQVFHLAMDITSFLLGPLVQVFVHDFPLRRTGEHCIKGRLHLSHLQGQNPNLQHGMC